ncbi:MAG: KH domain-containing protein [Desulfurococcales archaeon]|nr:KH domain-containing protein [Desulfurococcales archaeon]MEB3758563.1 KH domain-containing protein [Desulfurococcales archaeon]MEB3799517.1 KH domain-containing protein [Desulfurococcales archaeon]MEB3845634.1 KH domain-containing protein [Desulfurococcales archaeon]
MQGDMRVANRMHVKVPLERLPVIIGKEGTTKNEIMSKTGTLLTIDSENSMVIIEPEAPGVPPINVMKAADIVKAIGLGFTPEEAFSLLDEDNVLVVIDLKNLLGDNQNTLKRIKGRIIGEKGRARRTLEEMTGTKIVVGKYHVAIIGSYERAMAAKKAIEMLAEGRQHGTVYRHLDTVMRGIKRREAIGLWEERGSHRPF